MEEEPVFDETEEVASTESDEKKDDATEDVS